MRRQNLQALKPRLSRNAGRKTNSRSQTPATRAEQRRRAGIMLWEKENAAYKQRQADLSDREAFRLVLLENPTLAEQ